VTQPNDANDALGRLLKLLPTDVAPARDLWPGVAAAMAAPVRATSARIWSMRIAAGLACVAIGVGLGYGLLEQRVETHGGDLKQFAEQADTWLVKPVMLDAGYQKARTELATELFRRIAELPANDRARIQKGLRQIENGLRDVNDALKSNPDSVLLQQLALGAYQQELEYMRNIASLTQTVSESTQT
jgi:hypothetical protein